MLRSVATGKVLDVARGESADGTDLILYDNKERSLVEGERPHKRCLRHVLTLYNICISGMRTPEADNQVGAASPHHLESRCSHTSLPIGIFP